MRCESALLVGLLATQAACAPLDLNREFSSMVFPQYAQQWQYGNELTTTSTLPESSHHTKFHKPRHRDRKQQQQQLHTQILKETSDLEDQAESAPAAHYDLTRKERRRNVRDSIKANVRGVGSAAVDTVKALVNFVVHPVDSIKSVYQMVRHPVKAGKAVKNEVDETCRDEAYCAGKIAGITALTAATMMLTGGSSAGASAGSSAGSVVASTADDAANLARASSISSTAAAAAAFTADDAANLARASSISSTAAAAAASGADDFSNAAQIGSIAASSADEVVLAGEASSTAAATAAATTTTTESAGYVGKTNALLKKAGGAGKNFVVEKATNVFKDPKLHSLIIERMANGGKFSGGTQKASHGAQTAGRSGLVAGEIGSNIDRSSAAYAQKTQLLNQRKLEVLREIDQSSLSTAMKQHLYRKLIETSADDLDRIFSSRKKNE